MRKLIFCIIAALCIVSAKAQLPATATGNTLVNGTTASNASVASTNSAGFKLSIQGAQINWGTGVNTVTSPTIYLRNTTATNGKIWAINSDNAGLFTISEAAGTTTPLTHTNRFLISPTTGNVGIGIAAPAQKLDVNGMIKSATGFTYGSTVGGTWDINGTFSRYTTNATTDGIDIITAKNPSSIRLRINNAARGVVVDGASANFLFMGGSGETLSGIGNVNGTGNLAFLYSTAANSQTEGMRLTNTGKVGIGTTNPQSLLEVSGNNSPTAAVKTTGTTLAQMLVGDGANSFGLQYYPTGNCCWPAGTSVMTTGSSAGNLVFYTPNPLQFYIGGAERARFSAAGNFGLGNDPTEKLDVTGNVKFSGALMPNNAAGISGQVLTSAGPNAAPTWAPAGGGGSSQWTTLTSNIYFNTGNVGLGGITAPTAKLDILMASTTQPALRLKSIATPTANTFELQNAAGTSLIKIKPTDGVTYGQSLLSIDGDNKTNNPAIAISNIGNGFSGLSFTAAGGGSLELGSFNASPVWYYTNKHAKWMVNSGFLDPGSTDSYTFEHMNQTAATTLMLLKGQASQTGDMLKVQNSTGTDIFRIPADGGGYFAGNVGIGITVTTDPDYKLFVDKGIKTKKIKVTQAVWPDYVFHQQYKLPSLIEVEKFIKANNHLPDVPSAEEIEKDGLNLGDNQAVLLKKIEELTLYIIDLNKKSEEQNKKITEMEKRDNEMKEMKNQLDELKKMMLKK